MGGIIKLLEHVRTCSMSKDSFIIDFIERHSTNAYLKNSATKRPDDKSTTAYVALQHATLTLTSKKSENKESTTPQG